MCCVCVWGGALFVLAVWRTFDFYCCESVRVRGVAGVGGWGGGVKRESTGPPYKIRYLEESLKVPHCQGKSSQIWRTCQRVVVRD